MIECKFFPWLYLKLDSREPPLKQDYATNNTQRKSNWGGGCWEQNVLQNMQFLITLDCPGVRTTKTGILSASKDDTGNGLKRWGRKGWSDQRFTLVNACIQHHIIWVQGLTPPPIPAYWYYAQWELAGNTWELGSQPHLERPALTSKIPATNTYK